MDETTLCQRLQEIVEALTAPAATDEPRASRGTYASHLPAPTAQSAQQLLDYLRLRVKYLTFDLEATRRENRYLRQMLERRQNLGEPPENL